MKNDNFLILFTLYSEIYWLAAEKNRDKNVFIDFITKMVQLYIK